SGAVPSTNGEATPTPTQEQSTQKPWLDQDTGSRLALSYNAPTPTTSFMAAGNIGGGGGSGGCWPLLPALATMTTLGRDFRAASTASLRITGGRSSAVMVPSDRLMMSEPSSAARLIASAMSA